MTVEASLRDLYEFAQGVFGRPADVVVVNAGVTEVGRLGQDVVESKPPRTGTPHRQTRDSAKAQTGFSANQLGRFPKEPRLMTLDVNFAGAILTAKLAEEFWEKDSSTERNRQLVFLASMGASVYASIPAAGFTISDIHLRSTGGHSGIPGAPLYSASKHGLIGLWTAQCARIQRSQTPSFSHVFGLLCMIRRYH